MSFGSDARRSSMPWTSLKVRWVHGGGALALLVALFPVPARAEQGDARLGLKFAQQHCSRCHAILKTGASPEKLAPPFRELHLRYPIDDLAEALGEGIRTGHPMMPEFKLDADQIVDLLAYLRTLER